MFPATGPTAQSGRHTAVAEPFGVVLDPAGALVFCDLGNHRICRIELRSRALRTLVGTGSAGHSGDGGLARDAELREPYEVRFDDSGNLFFVDMASHVIRRVAAGTGHIATVAGTGEAGFCGDGGRATDAALRQPHSIEIARDGGPPQAARLTRRLKPWPPCPSP